MVAHNLLSTTSNIAIFSMFCFPAVAMYHAVSTLLLFNVIVVNCLIYMEGHVLLSQKS